MLYYLHYMLVKRALFNNNIIGIRECIHIELII